MKRLQRYHKVAFTGLMVQEPKGEWCKWRDVGDLIWEQKQYDFEVSEEYLRRKLCYKECFRKKLYVSLLFNVILFGVIIGAI